MNVLAIIVQLVSGAAGGNIAGSVLKKFTLGPIGNSIVGILGGGLGGQLLSLIGVGGANVATGNFDIAAIISSVVGGGVGGGVLMMIVGLIRQAMSKRTT